jgi:hypothetical protein
MVRLSALRACRPLPPERFLVLISLRGSVDRRATLRLEGFGQLKDPMNLWRFEPATFRFVASIYYATNCPALNYMISLSFIQCISLLYVNLDT